ncbi:MAG: T9SS type A sorting domain-containing protein [Saprospiraceae bacterium]|nr:T9SS type A sorting domain-containing protein [Saprospiraceae bacterium]
MKVLLTITCILCLEILPGMTQIAEHSLPFGFYSKPSSLKMLFNGHGLILGRGVPNPGAIFSDTLFAVIFDTNGDILYRTRLILPSAEVHRIEDVVPTPDGGFAISIELELCDASFGKFAIQKYDSTGQLAWSRIPDNNDKLCSQLALGSDGNLIGTDMYFSVSKFDTENGTTIWRYPLSVPPWINYCYINDFYIVSGVGTDDMIAVGTPDFQYWIQELVDGEMKYQLYNSTAIPPYTVPRKIIGHFFEQYYTYVDSTLYRFDYLNYEKLKKFPYEITDGAVSNYNIYLLCRQDSIQRLIKTNLLGQIVFDKPLPIDLWLSASFLSFYNNTFIIAGISGSGPTDDGTPPWQPFNAASLWYRVFTDLTVTPSESDDAAVTGVGQSGPMVISAMDVPWLQETRYQIEGGGFSIQVSNPGQTMLKHVDVLAGFEWVDVGICYERPAYRKRFSGLNLMPGESISLYFGNVFADFQPLIPLEICFWTDVPNERPDANHSNDTFCHTIIVDANQPVPITRLRIFPNPTSGQLFVELPENLENQGYWQVYSIDGRLVMSGAYLPVNNNRLLKINMADTPNGLYIVKMGSNYEKLVVNHAAE